MSNSSEIARAFHSNIQNAETSVIAVPIFNDNYIWVIYNIVLQEAVAVDPGDAEPLLAFLKKHNLNLKAILVTHHHPDHIGGINALQAEQATPVPVYGPASERILQITHPVEHHQFINLPLFEQPVQVIHTPGHTRDHLCYFSKAPTPWLFCGDTLFSAGCGRLFEGTPAQMYKSLNELASLDDETRVFCTHEYTLANLQFALQADPYNQDLQDHLQRVRTLRAKQQPSLPSTIALEKKINPFLRADMPDLAQNIAKIGPNKPKPGVETFAALRAWKDVS